MKILSLFDGISCARVALERAGIPVEAYYASEIDKYARQISQKNYPDIVQLGSVTEVVKETGFLSHYQPNRGIDLLIGGSPCQDLSIAKKDRKGLDGERSGLFWEYVRILKEVKPKYFILENVASMPKEAKAIITEALGVEPIMIDAALVSAQRRKRLFWTNIPNVTLPEDKGILLKDILEDGVVDRDKAHCIDANYHKGASYEDYKKKGRRQLVLQDKSYCIPATYYKENVKSLLQRKKKGLMVDMGTGGNNVPYVPLPDGTLQVREATKKGFAIAKDGDAIDLSFPNSKTRRGRVGNKAKNIMTGANAIHAFTQGQIRKLTPIECERLQCLPDNYTEGVSNTQRYKCLGNAFNVDVVAHLLSFIK